MLSAGLATLPKDRFIERQPGTIALPQDWKWDGLGLLIRSFWFGSNLPMGQEGGELQWSLRYEACSVLSCTPSRWAPSLWSLNP